MVKTIVEKDCSGTMEPKNSSGTKKIVEKEYETLDFHLLLNFIPLYPITKIYHRKKRNWRQDRLSSPPDFMNIQSTDDY